MSGQIIITEYYILIKKNQMDPYEQIGRGECKLLVTAHVYTYLYVMLACAF